jgi:hypothetical protein
MSDQVFQVRWRGKVSGPFPLVALQEMLARGDLSLLHEVLVERKWVPLEQLLATGDSGDASSETVPTTPLPKAIPPKPVPPPMLLDALYHVARHGRAEGPYPKGALKQLVSAGILDADDPAWTDGMPSWKPLKEIVELGAFSPAALPPTANPISVPKSVSGAHGRPSTQLATGMAAFAWYHSHEVRKELREMNDNLRELQDDSGAGDASDGGSWDFSDM